MTQRPRIAHFAGPNATIQNSPPLVTSNKARKQYGLPLGTNPDGTPARFDVLRPQRLAAPVTVYVEQFSAHPLERDAAELYGPPDGYVDADGRFHKERQRPKDKPVYEIVLSPEDGLYPLPYMARQADRHRLGGGHARRPARRRNARAKPFYPDGSRIFEEIDRLGIGENGLGNLIAARADGRFLPRASAGRLYQGPAAGERTDIGDGRHPARNGAAATSFPTGRVTSIPRAAAWPRAHRQRGAARSSSSGQYQGGIWSQGSPRIEETIYWLTSARITVPVCGNSAQRPHGQVSEDGSKNLTDSVDYIASRVWADEAGAIAPVRSSSRSSRSSLHATCRKAMHGRADTHDRRTRRHHRRGRL